MRLRLAGAAFPLAFAIHTAGEHWINGRMVRTARFKYCVYDRGVARESLFDLVNDPLETRNLARHAEWAAELGRARGMLMEHAREQGDTVAAACVAAAAAATNDLAPERRSR